MPSSILLLCGPARSGKSTRLAEIYRQALRQAPPAEFGGCLHIVPNQLAASEVRRALLASERDAFLSPGIETFSGFARRVLTAARASVRPLRPLQRRSLLRAAIESALSDGKLTFLRPAARRPGFLSQLEMGIAEWKRRDLWPETLIARQTRQTPAGQREIVELYRRYQQLLASAGLYDEEGLFWAARDALREQEMLFAGLRLVAVDGFSDFTAAQYDILSLLASRSAHMAITLPAESATRLSRQRFSPQRLDQQRLAPQPSDRPRRQELFYKSDVTAGRLARIAPLEFEAPPDALAAPPSAAPRHDANDAWPALRHLERSLFGSVREIEPLPESAYESACRIHVIEASSEQAEVEEAATQIKRLLLAGEDPHDIVGAMRSTADYAERIRSAFADCGIPLALDAPARLASAPLVRSMLNLLRLEADDWPYRSLLAVVGDRAWTSWNRILEGGTSVRGAMEREIRAAQVPGGRDALLRKLRGECERAALLAARRSSQPGKTASPPDSAFDDERVLVEAAYTELARLADILRPWQNPASLVCWLERLEALASALGAPGWTRREDAEALHGEAARENLAAWKRWREEAASVAQLEGWIGPGKLPASWELRPFMELAQEGGTMVAAPDASRGEGCVRVVSAEAARATRPRHLFLLGMAEHSFPASIRPGDMADGALAEPAGFDATFGAQEAIYGYGDEPATAGGGPMGADAAEGGGTGEGVDRQPIDRRIERQREEMLLFYQLVTRPSVSLTFSYPALDSKAQPLSPSPYLTEVERCLAGAPMRRTRMVLGRSEARDSADAEPCSLSRLRRCAVAAALQEEPRSLARLVRAPADRGGAPGALDGLEAIAWRGRWEGFGAYEGVFSTSAASQALARRFGAKHLWSPSQLETYAACPFKFFGEQLLALEPSPELRLASDYRRRGSLLHEALAQLHQVASSADDDPFGPLGEALADCAGHDPVRFAELFRQRVDAVYGKRGEQGVEGALREIERLQIHSWAEELARQHAAYAQLWPELDVPPTPTHLELRFGPSHREAAHQAEASSSTDKPFVLDLEGETIQLSGRIDRVDVGRVGQTLVFNVIDYKTSKDAKVSWAEIEAGKQLQLALYAMATEVVLASERARPLAAGFWAVLGGGFNTQGGRNSRRPALEISSVDQGSVRVRSEWEELKKRMKERIKAIVAEVRAGHFPVYNDDEKCGQYCHLKTICRIQQVRSMGKAWTPQ